MLGCIWPKVEETDSKEYIGKFYEFDGCRIIAKDTLKFESKVTVAVVIVFCTLKIPSFRRI
ncbi:hypothetical protein GCM10008933_28890 [Paenibacillus motobuensis]|uniref:Uncharacterized protein n=1 Tax=Paenibacillus motobuensis TaxID=295324 RepID=A0ABP3IBJ8_9BACL